MANESWLAKGLSLSDWRVRQPERARRRCGLRALMGGRTRQLHTRTLERPPDTHKHPSFAHVSFPCCSRIVPMSFPCPDPHRVSVPPFRSMFQSHTVVQVVQRGTCEDIWRQRYPGRRYATCHGPGGDGILEYERVELEGTSAHPSGHDILGTHPCNPERRSA